jgi:hypothetical protein
LIEIAPESKLECASKRGTQRRSQRFNGFLAGLADFDWQVIEFVGRAIDQIVI